MILVSLRHVPESANPEAAGRIDTIGSGLVVAALVGVSYGLVEGPDLGWTSAAVLGHNFPDSRWYKDAYNLVQQKGLQPTENKGSWISKAFKNFGLG